MMLATAALLLAAGFGQPATADDPVAKAPSGAVLAFAEACLLRLNVNQSPADYASGSSTIGEGVLADTPALKGVLVIDGAEGRGCRVRYTGAHADEAWAAFSTLYVKLTTAAPASCTVGVPATPLHLAATCVGQKESGDSHSATRRADLAIDRSASGSIGTVTAAFTNVRP